MTRLMVITPQQLQDGYLDWTLTDEPERFDRPPEWLMPQPVRRKYDIVTVLTNGNYLVRAPIVMKLGAE